jgi:hypothetical protein
MKSRTSANFLTFNYYDYKYITVIKYIIQAVDAQK